MKTKNLLLSGILGIALSGFVLTGCHKDSSSPDTDITAAQDESNASNVSNDSKSVTDDAVQGSQSEYAAVRHVLTPHCTVTWNDTSSASTDTMYVNFGSNPVLCNDGKFREGEIIVFWQKKTGSSVWQSYFDSGSTVTMTFRNYARGNASSNMVELNGTRTWTNDGGMVSISNVDCVSWSFSADLTLTYLASGKTATWNSSRTNTLVYEGGVWYYKITGSASGTTSSGVGYSLTITEPLYHTAFPWWLGGCPYIEQGQVTVTRTGKTNSLVINFGTIGNCSDMATAVINGNSYPFYML